MTPRPRSTRLDDPRALRAYAHPTRMALVALLRARGPMTATEAAAQVGESPSSCSFHLRQLARYGLVEEAGEASGRRRPWRATAMRTEWGPDDAPGAAEAREALDRTVADTYAAVLHGWLNRRNDEPTAWQDAAALGDVLVHLTAGELAALRAAMEALVEPFLDRLDDPRRRPDGSRAVTVLQVAIPVDVAARTSTSP